MIWTALLKEISSCCFEEELRADEQVYYLIVIYASPPHFSPTRIVNLPIAYSAWIARGIIAKKFTRKVVSELPQT